MGPFDFLLYGRDRVTEFASVGMMISYMLGVVRTSTGIASRSRLTPLLLNVPSRYSDPARDADRPASVAIFTNSR